MSDRDPVPPGYEPHFRESPVTGPWEPLFVRRDKSALSFGILIAPAHCNARGLFHSGVISALADNAMGLVQPGFDWHSPSNGPDLYTVR